MELNNKEHSIGKLIAVVRKERGFTQLQLAQLLNVSDKAISKWESDKGNPDITCVPLIAEVLGVSIDYLLTGCISKEQCNSDLSTCADYVGDGSDDNNSIH